MHTLEGVGQRERECVCRIIKVRKQDQGCCCDGLRLFGSENQRKAGLRIDVPSKRPGATLELFSRSHNLFPQSL